MIFKLILLAATACSLPTVPSSLTPWIKEISVGTWDWEKPERLAATQTTLAHLQRVTANACGTKALAEMDLVDFVLAMVQEGVSRQLTVTNTSADMIESTSTYSRAHFTCVTASLNPLTRQVCEPLKEGAAIDSLASTCKEESRNATSEEIASLDGYLHECASTVQSDQMQPVPSPESE
jgi:hypothetical protein